MIDLHCHILPGFDDGPGAMEGMLVVCRSLILRGESFESPEVVEHPRRRGKWWIFGKA
jgi:hypothetical protein